MSDQPRKLHTNIIQQNCYIRDFAPGYDSIHEPLSTFESIDEVTTPHGIELHVSTHDYPITPEYVDSFAQSADYRTDVAGSIARSVPGKNLGDITEIQNVSSMDMEHARALYSQLSERFANASQNAQIPNSKSEVNNNG
ncbi:hypothetical protein [Microvirus mar34]|uniref:Uncharacterized protein n=1 Tax=Microvirus mar34 TaxID=2851168 RepID=A0A8F5MKM7_9VIRU|nr:hypothetical protein [Microvirus mar34]